MCVFKLMMRSGKDIFLPMVDKRAFCLTVCTQANWDRAGSLTFSLTSVAVAVTQCLPLLGQPTTNRLWVVLNLQSLV